MTPTTKGDSSPGIDWLVSLRGRDLLLNICITLVLLVAYLYEDGGRNKRMGKFA
jgi:hypothetical protein